MDLSVHSSKIKLYLTRSEEKSYNYRLREEQLSDLIANGLVSFAASFDDLDCRRCLNARINGFKLTSDFPIVFKMTHFGEEIFYKISAGIKVIESFKSNPVVENDLLSGNPFGTAFLGHSPFSTLMLTINNTATFGPVGTDCINESNCYFNERQNISRIVIEYTISYYDSVFPDQNSKC